MPHILCRVVWSTEYKSKREKFFAGNMKYPKEHDSAHELLNFASEKGKVYGFVEHNDSRIKLQHLGGAANAQIIDGVTVIWAALDEISKRLKVVGWYENATVFREAQTISRSERGSWKFQFSTSVADAHVVPPSERFLEVPTKTKRTDTGYIGQRNWFFPDGNKKYARFLESFDSIRVGGASDKKIREQNSEEFEEGQRAFAEITLAARSPNLVAAAKRHYGYDCQVCGFNFEKRYGEIGKGFIEVHHCAPLSQSSGRRKTTVADVRVLCANCHRMVHRKETAMDISDLKNRLRKT